jgi:regulator of protease activity HflC (stomatin/prohibitin superfamily)
MDPGLFLVALLFVGLVVLIGGFLATGSVTVHDYERGLRFNGGKFAGLVDAGTARFIRATTEIRVLDVRPTSFTVEGQEVLTSDRVAVKISLVARYVIGDAAAYVMNDAAADRTLYLYLQLGLREVVAGRSVDEILAARTTIGPEILEVVAPKAMPIGIELTEVDVRDVMIPADLKRAFNSAITARHEGVAALERARGETAALRSLANAGRLVNDNPGLLSLRVVQELAAGKGNTIMLGLDGSGSGSGVVRAAGDRRSRTPKPSEADLPGEA